MTTPILLTGGTGTLGRLVVRRLRDAVCDVRVLSRRHHDSGDGIEFVKGDLTTGEGIEAAVEGAEIIVHCAGSSKGDEYKALNLVRAASRAGARHLVYISVVGADRIPVVSGVDRAMFGYFASKLATERVVASSGIPWTTLREGIGALKSGQPRLAKWLDLLGITAMGLAVLWAVWPRLRNTRRRARPLPPEAWMLTVAILVVPLCSGLLSSMNRYVASAWSGFVLLAAWLLTANVRVRWVVYGALALASIFFTRYWAQGEFIA